MNIVIPPRPTIGSPDIVCENNSYTIVATNKTITTNADGSLLDGTGLAQSLRYYGAQIVQAKGEVVVLVRADQGGARFNDTNLNRVATINWGAAGPVRNVIVVGEDKSIEIRGGLSMFDHTGDVRIENLTLTNSAASFAPFMVNAHALVGLMRLFNIDFVPEDPAAWNGKGMKWNVRAQGQAQWHMESLLFWGAQEHGAYIDNHQGDSYMWKCKGTGMGRTFCQWTNRAQSGPSAFGDLVLKECEARDIKGDGGSDYTIVGNGPGQVLVDACKSFGKSTGSQGAFVHWTDAGHGAYLTPDGYSSGGLVIRNFECDHPNADRAHVQIDGARNVRLTNWKIKGNKIGIQLNNYNTARPDNGSVGLLLRDGSIASQWSGWQVSKKIQRFNKLINQNQLLTNAQIDAMQVTL